ncbi:Glutathione S-transferase kappa 1 [Mortierella hygrophila]|uniref:Glutathione S-transferase kappa n=1 Tax=Mortierella hygrophila TaxID=979708 RepID=A0A9P6F3E9_9FUNG|nr:Glutathione S-transferase kappa 1 [Mortierella hygrophila]
MSARSSIVCYYDVVSPYSYYGVKLLQRYKPQWKDVDVELRPVFLAGVLSGSKNQAPGNVAAKGAYMFKDLNRLSTASGIPMNFPSNFPAMTVPASRLLVVIQKTESVATYEQCVEKEAYWVEDKDVSQQDILINVVALIIGTDKATKYMQQTSDKDIKQQLIDNTNEAIEAGAFGAPTFVIKKAGSDKPHLFFGSDRFEVITAFLGLPYEGLAIKASPAKL